MSEELLKIFEDFLNWSNPEKKSKSTRRRYAAALHSVEGYLVEEAEKEYCGSKTIHEFHKGYIDSGDGPLVLHDTEALQNELDTVCRRLYKYLLAQC